MRTDTQTDTKMNTPKASPLAGNIHAFSLLRFAFPSMVMMLFMGLYTIVDTVFVARFVDTNALSSINIVCPVIHLIVGLGTMLATGGSAIVAQKMGCGQMEEARSNFTLIIVAGGFLGLTVTFGGLLFQEEILRSLGASEVLFPYCRDYLTIQLLFTVGNMMQVLYQNLFVTAGKPAWGLVLSVLAGIANIVLDFVFIVLLQMGIRGAALGTGLGYMIPAIAGTIFFWKGAAVDGNALYFCRPKVDVSVLLRSCSNGASEMVSQLSAAVTTFLFNTVMMGLLGEDGVAAVTVIIYSQFLLTTLSIGFAMGTAPVISYHYGSGNAGQLRKAARICFCWTAAVSACVFLFSVLEGERICRIFAGEQEAVFEITRYGFSVFSFSFLFSGCNIFASAFFTALSRGAQSAVISFFRTFGFITVFLLLLPNRLGVTGVWLVIPLAEALTFLLAGCLVLRERGKTRPF